MQDGWVWILLLLGLLTFGGTLFIFWLSRVAANHRDAETLTTTDLRLLEESVKALIGRLKDASEEAVAEIDARQRRLQALLDRVDATFRDTEPPREPVEANPDTGKAQGTGSADDGFSRREVCRLAEDGVNEVEIARRSGLTRGEVELILELQASRR